MDGILVVLNELGMAVQQLKQMLAERDAKITELERLLIDAAPRLQGSFQPIEEPTETETEQT